LCPLWRELRYLAHLLSVAATLLATTPGLPAHAQTVILDATCPCRCGGHHDEDHDHDGPCQPGCTCQHCRHRAGHHPDPDPDRPGEDGSLLQGTDCPFCPFCPAGGCTRCCACQAQCCLPAPPAAPGPGPCLSRLAPEASLLFPPALAGSLIRPPRA
jgi:hypothetical protein